MIISSWSEKSDKDPSTKYKDLWVSNTYSFLVFTFRGNGEKLENHSQRFIEPSKSYSFSPLIICQLWCTSTILNSGEQVSNTLQYTSTKLRFSRYPFSMDLKTFYFLFFDFYKLLVFWKKMDFRESGFSRKRLRRVDRLFYKILFRNFWF